MITNNKYIPRMLIRDTEKNPARLQEMNGRKDGLSFALMKGFLSPIELLSSSSRSLTASGSNKCVTRYSSMVKSSIVCRV